MVLDQNGDTMRVPSWAPHWTVSDSTIAQVSRNGTMTAVGGGEVIVWVEVAGLGAATRFRMNPNEVELSVGAFYLNQAAQNKRGTVSLIAGRPAFARVFMVGDQTSYYYPSVRIRLFQGDEEVFQELLPPMGDSTSKLVIESNLEDSYNVFVPGDLIRPGVGVVVELDPEGVVPVAPGTRTRFPEEGAMALDVIELPLFRQIFVPTIAVLRPNESVFAWTDGLTPESEQVYESRTLMPIGKMEVEVHDTYYTSADLRTYEGWVQWLNETRLLHLQEGRRGYYYGVVSPTGPGIAGIANFAVPWSVGWSRSDIYAHELGHNMDLRHAPCGGAGGADLNYPYSGGSSGIWGFDVREMSLVSPDRYKDIMGYCNPNWVSDYHFGRATTHRLSGDGGVDLEGGSGPSDDAGRAKMLVVWGSVLDGRLRLDPAIVVDGPTALPETDGPYRVTGLGAAGETRFSLSFSPDPLEHGGGSFVYLVPLDAQWATTLDRMVLTGPEGEYTLSRDDGSPVALVTDPSTGTIQAIIRNWDGGVLPAEGTGNVTVFQGIPTGGGR